MSNLNFMEKLLDRVEVEWRPLGDISKLITKGTTPKEFCEVGINFVKTESFNKNNIDPSKLVFVSEETHSKELKRSMLEENDILFAIAGSIGKCVVVNKEILPANTNQALAIIRLDGSANVRYVFHYLQTESMKLYIEKFNKVSAQPNLNLQQISNFNVPIPCPENPEKSLEIQAEIVRILDAFTAHTAELTAELTARKKQYYYYRDKLLSFEGKDVEWKTLGDIGEFIRGKRFTKADYVEDGISVIHYGEIYTRYGAFTTHSLSQVRKDMAETLRYAEPGDVVITDVGETVEDVGKAVAWLGNEKVAIHDHCYAFRHPMNPKFVSYCMQTASFIAEKAKYIARTKVNTLLINGFVKVSIPVPYPRDPEKSLKEQARIVSILDKFDTLTNSISEGLPREIELRQKQYEYYRDLLLNFPKPEEVAA